MNNTTENDNKLIAEFMGAEVTELEIGDIYYPINGCSVFLRKMKYHESWDWIMPVVEKIEALGYGCTIGMGTYVVIQDDTTESGVEITRMTDNNKLTGTYEAVVEFIKWYNNNLIK